MREFEMTSNMKVLLVNPNWREGGQYAFYGRFHPVAPLELLYIKEELEGAEIPTALIDLWGEDRKLDEFRDQVRGATHLVVTTAPTYLFWRDGAMEPTSANLCMSIGKKLNPLLSCIAIGPQGSSVPNWLALADIDFVIRGDPETIVSELTRTPRPPPDRMPPGVCYRTQNGFEFPQECHELPCLSKLPVLKYPAPMLGMRAYPAFFDRGWRKSVVYEGSRGCPFSCSFCWRDGFRTHHRLKEPSRIEEELGALKKQGLEYLYFIDEIFGYDTNWLHSVSGILSRLGLKWACQMRPNLMLPEMIAKLADSGCVGLDLGVESVDREVLKRIGKGACNLDLLHTNIRVALSRGIRLRLFFVIGSPGDRIGCSDRIMKFLGDLPLQNLEICPSIATPLPNTPLWRQAIRQNRELRSWAEIGGAAGTVDNDFSHTDQARSEVFRLISLFRARRAKGGKIWTTSYVERIRTSGAGYLYSVFACFPKLYFVGSKAQAGMILIGRFFRNRIFRRRASLHGN